MKKFLKASLIIVVFSFITPGHDIVGRWITYNNDGSKAYVDFTKDGGFKVSSADGQIFHQGSYKLVDDVFSINDKEGCGDTYWGTYKFTFVGEDSIRIAVMTDSCSGRREQITSGNPGLKRFTK